MSGIDITKIKKLCLIDEEWADNSGLIKVYKNTYDEVLQSLNIYDTLESFEYHYEQSLIELRKSFIEYCKEGEFPLSNEEMQNFNNLNREHRDEIEWYSEYITTQVELAILKQVPGSKYYDPKLVKN